MPLGRETREERRGKGKGETLRHCVLGLQRRQPVFASPFSPKWDGAANLMQQDFKGLPRGVILPNFSKMICLKRSQKPETEN